MLLMFAFKSEFELCELDGASPGAAQSEQEAAASRTTTNGKSSITPGCWQDCLKDDEAASNPAHVKKAKDRFRKQTQKEAQKSKKGTRPVLALCFAFLSCISILGGWVVVVSESRCVLHCCGWVCCSL